MWNANVSDWRIWKIIYLPYFQLYGESLNDVIEGNNLILVIIDKLYEFKFENSASPSFDKTYLCS